MGRKVTPLSLLTVLLLTGILGLAAIALLLFARPSLLDAALNLPTVPAVVTAMPLPPTPSPAPVYPTLPPAWTQAPATPLPPSPTLSPAATAVVGGLTPLPDLNRTAQAAGSDARVSLAGDGLRLRSFPGTLGEVTANLEALTPLRIVGRTPDNEWIEVITPTELRGWVMAQYLDIYINLIGVPLSAGAALDATATPIPPDEARVSEAGSNLRVRQSPGTAGAIVGHLQPGMVLDIAGRTDDSVWLQITAQDGQQGWVMEQYVEVFINLVEVPVTGQAVNSAPPAPTFTRAPAATATPPPTRTPLPSPTATLPPPTATPSPTATPPPAFTNTGYLSGLSQHTRDIYLAGQAAGNRAGVFSKVGDSITVAAEFLFPIGSGQYNLRDYASLADGLAFFSATWVRTGNSFYNTSLAAKGGWSSTAVLSASQANKAYCWANESPLLCEYRLTRPAVALIMLGTNDVLDTSSEGYRANMRRIVADSVQLGIIPVLSTIPAFHRTGYEARADELNGIIASVAQEYDVPLWNYWAALQPLPNQGLSADGIHPSVAPNSADFTPQNLQYGYTVRNLTALQVLDAIWRQVMW